MIESFPNDNLFYGLWTLKGNWFLGPKLVRFIESSKSSPAFFSKQLYRCQPTIIGFLREGSMSCSKGDIPKKYPLCKVYMGLILCWWLRVPKNSVVPKMEESWTLFQAILGGRVYLTLHTPYPYSLYRWGFLYFRYLKCLVIKRMGNWQP